MVGGGGSVREEEDGLAEKGREEEELIKWRNGLLCEKGAEVVCRPNKVRLMDSFVGYAGGLVGRLGGACGMAF